jgi:hypothetical protein
MVTKDDSGSAYLLKIIFRNDMSNIRNKKTTMNFMSEHEALDPDQSQGMLSTASEDTQSGMCTLETFHVSLPTTQNTPTTP